MRDLSTIFKDEFPQRVQALSEAVASLNAANVVLEAHALLAAPRAQSEGARELTPEPAWSRL